MPRSSVEGARQGPVVREGASGFALAREDSADPVRPRRVPVRGAPATTEHASPPRRELAPAVDRADPVIGPVRASCPDFFAGPRLVEVRRVGAPPSSAAVRSSRLAAARAWATAALPDPGGVP